MSFWSGIRDFFTGGDPATHDDQGNPTSADPSGGLGDGSHGGGHQGAARGSVRAGTDPNQENYNLGGSSAYLPSFLAGTGYSGQQAVQNANQFNQQDQGIVGQAQSFGQSAGSLGQQQNNTFQGQANNAQGRQAPNAAYSPGLAAQQQQNGAATAGQMGLAAQLAAIGNAPEGPSAAQAQLQQGTNQAIASQLAMARSGRGLGESATGLSQAGQQASAAIANQANSAAALRAQETQQYRQNQLNALGASGQALGAAQSGSLGLAQQLAQQGQFGAQSQLQQQQLNDNYASQLAQLGLSAQGQGYQAQNQGLAQQVAAQNLGQQALQQGQALQATYSGMGLGAAQAQQQGLENYENELSSLYGMDIGAQVQNRQLNQADSTNTWNTVLGLASAIGSVASDRRAKKSVRDTDLDETFRALGGDDGANPSRMQPVRPRATQLSARYAALAD